MESYILDLQCLSEKRDMEPLLKREYEQDVFDDDYCRLVLSFEGMSQSEKTRVSDREFRTFLIRNVE